MLAAHVAGEFTFVINKIIWNYLFMETAIALMGEFGQITYKIVFKSQ